MNMSDDRLALELREDGTLQDIMTECYKDMGVYLKTFFPKRYYRPWGPDHKAIFEAMQHKDFSQLSQRQLVLVAQRGFGKTGIVRGGACWYITFDEARYILYLGPSLPNAERSTEAIKNMMINSRLNQKLFGSLRPDKRETDFSKLVWKLRLPGQETGTVVVPRGIEAGNRGLNYDEGELSLRPDVIIADDLEKDEQQKSDVTREEIKEGFMAVVKQLVDRGRMDYAPEELKKWRMFYVGTILGSDTLLEKLMQRDDWTTITAPLCDENFKARWPEFANDLDVLELKHEFKDDMDVFYREFMCLPSNPETATFKAEYFQSFKLEDIKDRLGNMIRLVLCDPAKTKTMSSADSAIVSVAVDVEDEKVYILNVFTGKVLPDELYDRIFEQVEKWQAQVYAVEVTSLHAFIEQPLRTEQLRRGLFPEFVDLQAVGKKEDRIRQLQPMYRRMEVYHMEDACGPLETQLLTYPKPVGGKWDAMDALAHLPQALDKCSIYIKRQTDNLEEQYAQLQREDEMMEDLEQDDVLDEFSLGEMSL